MNRSEIETSPSVLIALSGPLKGTSFELLDDEVTLGRHHSAGVRIRDLAVSRHHCRLARTNEGWRLRDTGSGQGTFVNDRAVHDVVLSSGDLVLVASSTFLFIERERTAEPEVPSLELTDEDWNADTAVRFAVEDSDRQVTETLGSLAESAAARRRTLAALLRVGAAASRQRGLESYGREVLEQVLTLFPAQRAALLRLDRAGESEPVAWWSSRPTEGVSISRTVIRRVAREKSALVWSAGGGVIPADSVAAAGIAVLISVPLVCGGRTVGVLYLDSRDPTDTVDEGGRLLLSVVAGLIASALEERLHLAELEEENERLQSDELGCGLIGESPRMRRVFDLIRRVAPSSSTVLLLGESGTGKELAARAVHAASPRAAKPFVAINCATLSENLLESELFGHEKGAFTGAVARQAGKLEIADGGTLFLDEIGEIPLPLQAKLLRVLQERCFERVGATRPITVDIRLIAATNRDLVRSMAEGTFREDLYHRLNVISVTLPPLRQRPGDIELLASHFAAHHGRSIRGRPVGLSAESRAVLAAYDWPGNVRELSNAIERAVVLGQDEEIRPEDLPDNLLEGRKAEVAAGTTYHQALNDLKRELILDALDTSGGNVTRAAEQLDLHPNHLHRLITNLDLRQRLSGS